MFDNRLKGHPVHVSKDSYVALVKRLGYPSELEWSCYSQNGPENWCAYYPQCPICRQFQPGPKRFCSEYYGHKSNCPYNKEVVDVIE